MEPTTGPCATCAHCSTEDGTGMCDALGQHAEEFTCSPEFSCSEYDARGAEPGDGSQMTPDEMEYMTQSEPPRIG